MQETTILIFKRIFSWVVNNLILVIFLSIGIYLTYVPLEFNPRVIFLDVGQGDAILLIDSSGQKILIDGGGGDYVVYSLTNYLHPRDRYIDTVILTHPHEDHLSGLIDVLERFEVGEVLYYPACYNSTLYKYFLSLEENFKVVDKGYEYNGESFNLKSFYPIEEGREECMEFSNINNASIVTRLESASGSVLFMGDAEHEVEELLMKNYKKEFLQSDVLKAGHHCSRTASSEKFLNFISPKYAICCVGEENKFGHPHDEVIENFRNLGIKFYLTYEEGDIVLEL
jgi:competence protein ComEC